MIKRLANIYLNNENYIKNLMSQYKNINELSEEQIIDEYLLMLGTNKAFADKIQLLYEKQYGELNADDKELYFDWGAVIQIGGSLFNTVSSGIQSKKDKDAAAAALKDELAAQKAGLQLAIQNAKNEKEKAVSRNKTINTVMIFSTIITVLIVSGILIKTFLIKKSK